MDASEQLSKLRRDVDYDSYNISVKQLISMIEDEIIIVDPDYQRRFRWNETRQSALIESLFLGIPVPSLFMATNSDSTWDVVDGLQRLSSLIHFAGEEQVRKRTDLGEPLKLQNLEKLTTFEGEHFEDLSESMQRRFILCNLPVVTMTDKSDKNVRYDLFKRLNTGGVELADQEIRNSVYRGPFNDLLNDLALQDNFRTVVNFTEREEKDGTPAEYVLRFFAYYHRYEEFGHLVEKFLNNFMEDSTKSFDYRQNINLFDVVFDKLASAFPDGITRGRRSRTPSNVYEGVTVGAALAYDEIGDIHTGGAQKWIESKEFRKFTTSGTNTNPKVRGRIEFARDKFMDSDATSS